MNFNLLDLKELPHKRQSNKKWSFFYAYNLKTIRDIFIFVSQKSPTERELYGSMDKNELKPPKDKWSNEHTKDRNRLKLEYLHATKYLGLIKETDNRLVIDLQDFCEEKEGVIKENINRNFFIETESPKFTSQEISYFKPIILNYSRAKEYLWWFLDFDRFSSTESFNVETFQVNAQPIYLNKSKDKKASELMYRIIDNKFWKIPFEEYIVDNSVKRTDDYTRAVSYVFPTWFQELHLINRIPVLKEFGFFDGNWELHYPISDAAITLDEFEFFLLTKFNNKNKLTNVIWIPLIIYETVLKFKLPIERIKDLLIELYEYKKPRYIMERSSLQVMRYSKNLRNNNLHKELFLNYRNFNRNNFIINN